MESIKWKVKDVQSTPLIDEEKNTVMIVVDKEILDIPKDLFYKLFEEEKDLTFKVEDMGETNLKASIKDVTLRNLRSGISEYEVRESMETTLKIISKLGMPNIMDDRSRAEMEEAILEFKKET